MSLYEAETIEGN